MVFWLSIFLEFFSLKQLHLLLSSLHHLNLISCCLTNHPQLDRLVFPTLALPSMSSKLRLSSPPQSSSPHLLFTSVSLLVFRINIFSSRS